MLSAARCRAMLKHSTEALSLITTDGVVAYMSPGSERVLGRPAADFVDRDLLGWISEPDRPRMTEAMRQVKAEPSRPVSFELRVDLPDGSPRWLEATVTNLLDDPSAAALLASFRDITTQRMAMQALQDSERRYRLVVEASPEPVIVHVDQKIAYVNLAGIRMLGASDSSALIGRSVLELATSESRLRIAARMAAPGGEGAPLALDRQTFLRVDDHREVHVEVNSTPFIHDGRPAMLSIARDITRRVEAERVASPRHSPRPISGAASSRRSSRRCRSASASRTPAVA